MGISIRKLFSPKLTRATLPGGKVLDVQLWDEGNSRKLPMGDQFFRLEREPQNSMDPYAVKVYGDCGWLGYLHAPDAKRYAKILDTIPVPIRVAAKVRRRDAAIWIASPVDLPKWIRQQRFA